MMFDDRYVESARMEERRRNINADIRAPAEARGSPTEREMLEILISWEIG